MVGTNVRRITLERRCTMKKVLVVAAHPDDEILGVGGTVLKHTSNGDRVECIILGEGQMARFGNESENYDEIVQSLHDDAKVASRIIGYQSVYFANFPDNRFDSVDLLDVIKYIENIIRTYKPDIIYTHFGNDLNIDHKIAYQAVMTATRPVNDCPVKEIYLFETLSATEWNFKDSFRPNLYIDIAPYMEKKIMAMKAYITELCEFPHPRSIEGIEFLAKYRAMQVGKTYVEAFEILRKIES